MASISFTCPNCAKVLRTGTRPPTGKKVRCPTCSQVFVPDLNVEEEAASIQEKPSARPKLKSTKAEDDADPAPPRKKRMRDEEDADEDDRPVKKKKSKTKQASSSTMLFVLVGLAGGGGLLSCILCGVGAYVWPGFMKSANTDLAAFVPEDANLVMGGNPKLLKSRMANLEQLLRQQGPFGAVNQQQMEDVTFNSERMLAFSNTKNVQGGLVTVYQSSADDIAKIKRNPGLGAATTIGGHGNIHKQGMQARAGTLPRYIAFPGGNIVVTAEQNERDLLAALDRARDGAKPNAALEFGRSVDQSPFWLAFVPDANSIAQIRKGIEDGGPMAPQGMKDAAPALAGIKGATVVVKSYEIVG